MLELPDDWMSILEAIRSGDAAWRDPRELAWALGRPVDAALDTMAEMHLAGWLEVWERDDGLVVTLSPLAAERLGTYLVETRQPDQTRWSRPEEPQRHVVRSGDRARPTGEAVANPADPREGQSVAARVAESSVGPPTLLIGVGLCPWPGPRQGAPPNPCPACRGVRLDPAAYCLRCDRWGRAKDGFRPRSGPRARPRPPADPATIEARRRAERARRQARRKALLKDLARRTTTHGPARTRTARTS
jgi:hypothetical protein